MSPLPTQFQDVLHLPCESTPPNPSLKRTPRACGFSTAPGRRLAQLFAIAVYIGMFLFWRFARFGFVCLTALSVVLVPFDGLVVMAPVEASLLQLALIIDGVIVAMAYLPPIGGQFEPGT